MSSGTGREIVAGQAYIRLRSDDRQFERSVRNQTTLMRRFAGVVRNLGAAFTAFGTAIAAGLVPVVRAAANAESAMRRLELVMSDLFPSAIQGIRRLSSEYQTGFTTIAREFASFAATFSDLRQQVSPDQFLRILSQTSRAVINLSALAGISMEEASARIKSAFTSTGEAVDQFGINLRQAELRNEAMRLGLGDNIRMMTEAQKQLVKLSIITRTFADINFDANRAAMTFNVQLARLQSNIYELLVAMGRLVKAALTPFFWAMNQILRAMQPLSFVLAPIVLLVAAFGATISVLGAAFLALAGAITLAMFALNQYIILQKLAATAEAANMIARIALGWTAIRTAIQAATVALRTYLAALGPVGWAALLASVAVGAGYSQSGGLNLADRPRTSSLGRAIDAATVNPTVLYSAFRSSQAGQAWRAVASFEALGGMMDRTFDLLLGRPAQRAAAATSRRAISGVAGTTQPFNVTQQLMGAGAGQGSTEQNISDLRNIAQRVVEGDEVKVSLLG